MSDMDDHIRETLRRRANDVSSHAGLPAGVARRVHRRIALNAVGAGLAAAAIVVGAFAGVHALRGAGTPQPVPPAASTSTGATPKPSPSVTPPCDSSSLRATLALQGAAGSRVGSISVTNTSPTQCTLEGTPTIALYDATGQPVTSGVTYSSSSPSWQVNASPTPRGWPTVTLDPNGSASVRIGWSNWCGQGTPSWKMSTPDGGTIDIAGVNAVSTPPCNGPGMPSRIDVGPFEPGS